MEEKSVGTKENATNKEKLDFEKIADEIIAFLKKWGLFRATAVYLGNKCYTEGKNGEIEIREEKCFRDLPYIDYDGPLFQLLIYGVYEVQLSEVSEEIRRLLISESYEYQEMVEELLEDYHNGEFNWDPMLFDSYEEWSEITDFPNIDELTVIKDEFGKDKNDYSQPQEFSSKEEYEDFLNQMSQLREARAKKFFEDYVYHEMYIPAKDFCDEGHIAKRVLQELQELEEKYRIIY